MRMAAGPPGLMALSAAGFSPGAGGSGSGSGPGGECPPLVSVGVCEGEAPREGEAEGEPAALGVALGVAEGVTLAETVPVSEALGVGELVAFKAVAVGESVGESVGEGVALSVPVALDEPLSEAVAVADADDDSVSDGWEAASARNDKKRSARIPAKREGSVCAGAWAPMDPPAPPPACATDATVGGRSPGGPVPPAHRANKPKAYCSRRASGGRPS